VIPVTELKQWAYCPRVVYYHRRMPGAGAATHKMEEALRAQDWWERLELRRSLGKYGMQEAGRRFDVWLSDGEVGLSGRIDLLLTCGERAAVVDYKLTSGEPGHNHRMQLAGYALLVEKCLGLAVPVGLMARIPDDRVFEIPMTGELLAEARAAVLGIGKMAELGLFPGPTAVRGRCTDCEYANFCGDVW
jgi:CRISPR-associated exonuclease Cas4